MPILHERHAGKNGAPREHQEGQPPARRDVGQDPVRWDIGQGVGREEEHQDDGVAIVAAELEVVFHTEDEG